MNSSILARNAGGDAQLSLLNAGSQLPVGYIEFRAGVQPASVATAPIASNTLLATLPMSNPAFKAMNNGQAVSNTITSSPSNVVAGGIVTWFRMYNRDRVAIFDGSVKQTGQNGDIEMERINFVVGGTIRIDTPLVVTAP